MDQQLRDDLEAAAARMSTRLGSKREIRKLVEHLWEGERVQRMTSGTYSGGMGLVVLTDRRLIFLKDGWMSQTSEDFPLERVSSIQWSAGLIHGTIIVFASGNKAEITAVPKPDGKEIVDLIRARLTGQAAGPQSGVSMPTPPAQVSPASPPQSAADPDQIFRQLRQLGELRESGVLTAEEFDAKKAELLTRL